MSSNNSKQQQNVIDDVTETYLQGDSIQEIAASKEMPEDKVIELLKEGLSEYKTRRVRGDRLKKDDRRIIEFFHNQGYSNYFLANLLDCSKTTIANELRRSNVVERTDPYSSEIAQDDYNLKNYIELGQKKIKRNEN